MSSIVNLIRGSQCTTDTKINSGFVNTAHCLNNLKNNHVVFIGDSHVEFLARCRSFETDFSYSHTTSIWLGPKTLLGYQSQPGLNETAVEIRKLIEPSLRSAKKNKKQVKIFWCMGTIDIRFSIYELILRGAISSDADAYVLIEKAADFIIGTHLPEIIAGYESDNITFGYVCCTNILGNGMQPATIKEANKIKKETSFPTFGSEEQRDKLMTGINSRIHKVCKRHGVIFLAHPMGDAQTDREQLSIDGIHLTDPVVIARSLGKALKN